MYEKVLIEKKCAVCLDFMLRPCKFPSKKCEHRFCMDCLEQIIVFKKEQKTVPQCPICRVYQGLGANDEIKLDETYLKKMKIDYPEEFKAEGQAGDR